MKRSEAKELAAKYGMEIMRDPITSLAHGLYVFSDDLIPELDAYANKIERDNVYCKRTCLDPRCPYLYRLECPTAWFDLWGWTGND